jgi:predicted DNA-binding transcriptional regulator AlpA
MEHGERLTLQQVAQKMGCSDSTMRRLMEEAHFPPPFLIGKSKFWWEADITAYQWLASRGSFGPPPKDLDEES